MPRRSQASAGLAAFAAPTASPGRASGAVQRESSGATPTDRGGGGSNASRSATWFPFLAAGWLVVGSLLRCARLGAQVFGGDEGHLLWAIFEGRFPELLFAYAPADFSLPMAGFGRALFLLTGSVGDLSLRGLPLVFGFGLLLLPIAARRRVGDQRIVAFWLALIALSPALIAYSRIARSYGPATTLACAAVLALAKWLEDPRPKWGVLSSVCGALAVYFHPLVGLLPATAFGVTWLVALADKPGGRRLQVTSFALLWGALCASFLIPGGPALLASLSEKSGRSPLSAAAFAEAWRLLSGSRHREVAAAITLFAALGVARGLARREPLTYMGLGAVAAQLGLVAISAPVGLDGARVLGRYLLPAWPWVLLWTATGLVVALSWLTARLGGSRWIVPATVVAALALAALGPLTGRDVLTSSFLHANEMLGFTRPLRSVAGLPVPEPYRRLTGAAGAVIEYPLHFAWAQSVAVPNYQRAHGRKVLVARPFRPWNEPGLRLEAHVADDPEAFLQAPAAYLFVHRDPAAEERRVLAYLKPMARRQYSEVETLRAAAHEMETRLRATWGSPDLESAEVAVWNLERVRRSLRDRGIAAGSRDALSGSRPGSVPAPADAGRGEAPRPDLEAEGPG